MKYKDLKVEIEVRQQDSQYKILKMKDHGYHKQLKAKQKQGFSFIFQEIDINKHMLIDLEENKKYDLGFWLLFYKILNNDYYYLKDINTI